MARKPRFALPELVYHITQRGNYDSEIFLSDEDREFYLKRLDFSARKYGFEILGYCLLSNHIHLVGIPHEEASLARSLSETHMCYSQYFNRRMNTVGHLWQGRFHSAPIEEERFSIVMRYVEKHPVRSGIVSFPEEWIWSSAKAHLFGRDDPVISGASLPKKDMLKNWRGILDAEDDETLIAELRQRTYSGLPFGSEKFVKRLEKITGKILRPMKAGRPKKKT